MRIEADISGSSFLYFYNHPITTIMSVLIGFSIILLWLILIIPLLSPNGSNPVNCSNDLSNSSVILIHDDDDSLQRVHCNDVWVCLPPHELLAHYLGKGYVITQQYEMSGWTLVKEGL